ncbi:MAG: response regulator transcription factor [Pseudomonadota bacterium]
MKDHILIVDDDSQVTSFLERFFEKNGYQATGVSSASDMFAALERLEIDLVVLDLILPDEDGLDAARRLHNSRDLPIIMLSARNEAHDRIVGLELGADDYVTKPYEPRELLARVRSVLRRHRRNAAVDQPVHGDPDTIVFDGIALNWSEGTALHTETGQSLNLTSTELALLRCVVDAQGEVVSRGHILDAVYGAATTITDRAIDAHMVRLRRKLASAVPDRDVIVTVHGKGYRLAAKTTALS